MKIVACFFSLLLGFLTVQPILSGREKNAERIECCSPKKCQKPDSPAPEKNDCASTACNPFMACVLGNFYTNEVFIVQSVSFTVKKQKILAVNDNRLLTRLSDCWHPPEFV